VKASWLDLANRGNPLRGCISQVGTKASLFDLSPSYLRRMILLDPLGVRPVAQFVGFSHSKAMASQESIPVQYMPQESMGPWNWHPLCLASPP
jgi:hypothetical protein